MSDKKRTKLTVTAMVDAIGAIYLASLGAEAKLYNACTVTLNRNYAGHYAVDLLANLTGCVTPQLVHSTAHEESYEAALALLLEHVEQLLEEQKRRMLADVVAVADKYKSVLTGARGKLKKVNA